MLPVYRSDRPEAAYCFVGGREAVAEHFVCDLGIADALWSRLAVMHLDPRRTREEKRLAHAQNLAAVVSLQALKMGYMHTLAAEMRALRALLVHSICDESRRHFVEGPVHADDG
jgi:uncharacterized protein YciW